MDTAIDCPNTNANPSSTKTYRSDFDTAHVTIPPSSGSTTPSSETIMSLTCTVADCMQNSYKTNGQCVLCPPNSVAPAGSIDLSACQLCPGGMYLSHKFDSACTLSNEYSEIISSLGWRIWATDYQTIQSWVWDVKELEFYDNESCSGAKIDTSTGNPINSGNAGSGWGPQNAFDGGASVWGGRPNADNLFWLGMEFTSPVSVKCVRVQNSGDKGTTSLRVQALDSNTGRWQNSWIYDDLDVTPAAWNTISMVYGTQSPTTSKKPSESPTTSSPTNAPSQNPSKAPTLSPTIPLDGFCSDNPTNICSSQDLSRCACSSTGRRDLQEKKIEDEKMMITRMLAKPACGDDTCRLSCTECDCGQPQCDPTLCPDSLGLDQCSTPGPVTSPPSTSPSTSSPTSSPSISPSHQPTSFQCKCIYPTDPTSQPTSSPTFPPVTSSPTEKCEPIRVSCTDKSVNCCNGCSGGRPANRVCL